MSGYWGETSDKELFELRLREILPQDVPKEKIDSLLKSLDNYIDEKIQRRFDNYDRR